jgi:uncharacterized membrane protein
MFRDNTNKLFLLIVCVIPSIVLLWDGGWVQTNVLESLYEIVSRIFGIGIFIFLPCFLTMKLADSINKQLEPGKKWLVALIYFPVSFMMVVAVYSVLEMTLKPELGSSTSGLVMVLPMIYGVPAAGVIYFIMNFFLNRKKKPLN